MASLIEAEKSQVTAGWLVDRLQQIIAEYGPDIPVFIQDADTDWSMPVLEGDGIRFGKDECGYGEDGAVMIAGGGYEYCN